MTKNLCGLGVVVLLVSMCWDTVYAEALQHFNNALAFLSCWCQRVVTF